MYSANVDTLPEDIHFLYNLTNIDINFCHKLETLPNNLSLCSKLETICIKNCFRLKGFISNELFFPLKIYILLISLDASK